MIRKSFFLGLVFCIALLPDLAFATPASETPSSPGKDAQSLLSAFMSYTDLRISSIQRSLEILASTTEGESGNWQSIKGLLSGYQKSESGLIVWYVRPDGTYYSISKLIMP